MSSLPSLSISKRSQPARDVCLGRSSTDALPSIQIQPPSSIIQNAISSHSSNLVIQPPQNLPKAQITQNQRNPRQMINARYSGSFHSNQGKYIRSPRSHIHSLHVLLPPLDEINNVDSSPLVQDFENFGNNADNVIHCPRMVVAQPNLY